MKLIMSIVWTVCCGVVLAYVALCVLLYLMQDGQVYVPSRTVDFNPGDTGLKFEDLYLSTSDGEKINAWYVPAGSASNELTVLFCHGNGGDLGSRVEFVRALHDMGFSVMIFDYRGYGNSSGKASEEGTLIDARTALDYLIEKKDLKAKDLVFHGRSLGGAVAVALASQVEPAKLIVESSFTSAPDMAKKMFPYLPSRLLCRYKYDSKSIMGSIKCPVLITHSRADEMIPFSHSEELFRAATEPKQFLKIHGEHNTSGLEGEEEYRKAYLKFVLA